MIKKEILENQLDILERYKQTTMEVAKEIIFELKKGCKTYKEVDKNLYIFKKTITFSCDWKNYQHLISIISELLENEKNDLLVTNRSK